MPELNKQQLEQENAKLLEKIKLLETQQEELKKQQGSSLTSELAKIRKKAGPAANSIKVHEYADHKNISLWTKYGKRIGPLHPDNAIQTLQRFAANGILLVVDKPTPDEIDAYVQTAEYKLWLEKEVLKRQVKDDSRKSGQAEKLIAQFSKEFGVAMKDIAGILKPDQVKPGKAS